MATIASVTTFGEAKTVTWETLTETNADGLPTNDVGSGDSTFQATGTFGGGAVVLQGSLDGTNWFTLNDPLGDPISLSAAGLVAVLENTPYKRPFVASGTGVDIDAKLITRRAER